jgi:hypothetical protein
MSTSQIIAVTGAAQQSSAIASTKARVAASVPFYYAVGSDPTASPTFANTRMIPANVITSINMEGLGNKISVIFAGTTGNVSITTVGTVTNQPT